MADTINAEVIAIGTEILLGEITDTNSVYIAQQLRHTGINLYFMTSVGDNTVRIASAIQIGMSRAQVIITCGGLGPTVDDMTRQGIALATGRALVFHQHLFDQIAARFATLRSAMTENNRQQAFLPDGAIPIENPVGTAPGFIVEHEDKVIISLPGVPREMKFLMSAAVLPYLRKRYALGMIKARVLKTAGIGESALDEMLGKDILEGSNPTVGLNAHHGIIDVRITAKAEDESRADRLLDTGEQAVRERIGDYIFGKDQDTLEEVLTQQFETHDKKLVVLEAGIGEAVINRLQTVSGGRDILVHTAIYPHPQDAYSEYPQFDALSLRDFAEQSAAWLCQQHGADIAIVILSLPDVGENADNISEATAVAVYSPKRQQSRSYGFGAKADITRDWVSRWSMGVAWRMITEQAKA